MMRSGLCVVPTDSDTLTTALTAALVHGADAVVVDLVDRVAPDAKEQARKLVAVWLRGVASPVPVWVQVNPGQLGHDDARALVGPGLAGLCLSRTETPVALDALDSVLTSLELDAGLPPRSVALAPVLATAGSVLAAPAIARVARVTRLHLAEASLRAELGVQTGPDEGELLLLRSQVVLASAAAGIEAPVAVGAVEGLTAAALRDSTRTLRRLGFGGRICTSTHEIEIVNSGFGDRSDRA